MKIKMVVPTMEYKTAVEEARKELCSEFYSKEVIGTNFLTMGLPYEKWLDYLKVNSDLKHKETVKCSQFLIIDLEENKLVGFLLVNYELNSSLSVQGGNVIVSVLDRYRKQGVGRTALSFGIKEAVRYGLREVLLTAAGDDYAGIAMIKGVKGIEEGPIRYNQATHKYILRFYLYFDEKGRLITKQGRQQLETDFNSLGYKVDREINGAVDSLIMDERPENRMYANSDYENSRSNESDDNLLPPNPPEGFLDPLRSNITYENVNQVEGSGINGYLSNSQAPLGIAGPAEGDSSSAIIGRLLNQPRNPALDAIPPVDSEDNPLDSFNLGDGGKNDLVGNDMPFSNDLSGGATDPNIALIGVNGSSNDNSLDGIPADPFGGGSVSEDPFGGNSLPDDPFGGTASPDLGSPNDSNVNPGDSLNTNVAPGDQNFPFNDSLPPFGGDGIAQNPGNPQELNNIPAPEIGLGNIQDNGTNIPSAGDLSPFGTPQVSAPTPDGNTSNPPLGNDNNPFGSPF